MVEAIFTQSEDKNTYIVTVVGHADYAEEGRDIVCSAVSALIYTLAQNVRDCEELGWLRKKPVLELEDGNTKITCKPRVERRNAVKLIFTVIQRGMEMIAVNYPDHVGITKMVTDTRPSMIKKEPST